MKKLFLIIFSIIELNAFAQDPASSQFYFNQLYMNPAFCGINNGARIGGNYRTQWTAITSKFETYNVWADIYNPYFNGGLGVIAMRDVSGEGYLTTSTFGIIQSYEKVIPKVMRIRAGYDVMVTNRRIDWDKLIFSDQINAYNADITSTGVFPGSRDGKTFADFQAGGMIDVPKIKRSSVIITNTFGYSMNHLTEPNESLDGAATSYLPRKQTFHYTMVIELLTDKIDKKPFYISPNIIFERQAKFQEIDFGFFGMRKPVIGGLFYRNRKMGDTKNHDSFILFLGLHQDTKKNTVLKLGYSYDFTINQLAGNTMGSHEISIILELKNKRLFAKNVRLRKRNKKAIQCEDFGERSFIF